MQRESLKCPECTATMTYDEKSKTFTCPYCGHKEIKVSSDGISTDEYKERYQARLEAQVAVKNQQEQAAIQQKRQKKVKTVVIVITVFIVLFSLGLISSIFDRINTQNPISTLERETLEDPFSYCKIEFSGVSGKATIKLTTTGSVSREDLIFQADKNTGLSNGDTVTITAISARKYKFEQSTKTIAVEGLNYQLKSASEITDNIAQAFHEMSETRRMDITGAGADSIETTPYDMIVLVCEDLTYVFDVYQSMVTRGDKTIDVYWVRKYNNVYLTKDGSISPISYSSMDVYGMSQALYTDITLRDSLNAFSKYYCGYFMGFYSMNEIKTLIKSNYPNAIAMESLSSLTDN